MYEKIKDIQNTLWKAYTDFRKTKDMGRYNETTKALVRKYQFDPAMRDFCQTLMIAWAPVVNMMKEWAE